MTESNGQRGQGVAAGDRLALAPSASRPRTPTLSDQDAATQLLPGAAGGRRRGDGNLLKYRPSYLWAGRFINGLPLAAVRSRRRIFHASRHLNDSYVLSQALVRRQDRRGRSYHCLQHWRHRATGQFDGTVLLEASLAGAELRTRRARIVVWPSGQPGLLPTSGGRAPGDSSVVPISHQVPSAG